MQRHVLQTRDMRRAIAPSGHPWRLELVVLGGSASSRPGDDCAWTQEEGKRAGRYSSLLQQRLQEETANATSQTSANDSDGHSIDVINRAQGSTESSINALLLDEVVDPNTTDIIVWEYLINGAYRPSH